MSKRIPLGVVPRIVVRLPPWEQRLNMKLEGSLHDKTIYKKG